MPNQPTDSVRFRPDIEPYVQLMERTPREACVPTVVEQLRRGLTYRQFLEALMLAGIRKSNSGHEVYLVHAAHQMSLDARHEDRLLPLFWALDSFKRQQEALPAPPISSLKGNLPPQEKAPREFHDAIRQFDRERSELAIIALARSRGPEHAIQHLWHYGARDWDSIGHHAIALANCFRTLQAINWKHAEPVLRFVIRHLVGRPENQSYYPNVSRAKRGFEKLEHAWDHAGSAPEATLELFAVMREGEVDEACELASGLLIGNRATAGAIWDAVHLTAGDLMVRFNDESRLCTRPLHANTSANALHYSFGNYILDKVIMNQTCLVHSSRDASYRSTPVFDHDPLEFNHIRLDFSNLLFRSGSLVCKLSLRVLVVCFKAIIRTYRRNGFNNHVLKRLRKVYSAPVQIVTGHVISPLFTLSSI